MAKGKIKHPKGFMSFKQLADFLRLSPRTLQRHIEPLRPFLFTPESGRKDLYTPDEVDFVIKNLR